MRHPPRGLTPEEAALWARLAATVKPLHPRKQPAPAIAADGLAKASPAPSKAPGPFVKPARSSAVAPARPATPPRPAAGPVQMPRRNVQGGLDSHWERRLGKAAIAPDFTLDLHDHTLDQAHARLDAGLLQAKAMGARLVLLVTGRPRPAEAADRGSRRGAIRSNVLDWLAAGPHAGDIAAIRKAHPRHGGDGALYLVLRRKR